MSGFVEQEVIEYLLQHPEEVKRIKRAIESDQRLAHAKQLREMRPNVPVKMVPCGTYGCTEPKPEGAIFCKSCYQDYLEDPDAYK